MPAAAAGGAREAGPGGACASAAPAPQGTPCRGCGHSAPRGLHQIRWTAAAPIPLPHTAVGEPPPAIHQSVILVPLWTPNVALSSVQASTELCSIIFLRTAQQRTYISPSRWYCPPGMTGWLQRWTKLHSTMVAKSVCRDSSVRTGKWSHIISIG